MTKTEFKAMLDEIDPVITDLHDPKLPDSLYYETMGLLERGLINGGTTAIGSDMSTKTDINMRLSDLKVAIIAYRAVAGYEFAKMNDGKFPNQVPGAIV